MARQRVDIAERLKQLNVDPVEGMARIARRAEEQGNLALAAKVLGDLLEYTAPKLKSMEVKVDPATLETMDRLTRLRRIEQLWEQVKMRPAGAGNVIEGELVPLLNHEPDKP